MACTMHASALAFSLTPPTGRTEPLSVSSPLIAVSARASLPVKSDASATSTDRPADGPSCAKTLRRA
eukprot:5837095-Pleurochrysis_carterae.AAC.1